MTGREQADGLDYNEMNRSEQAGSLFYNEVDKSKQANSLFYKMNPERLWRSL